MPPEEEDDRTGLEAAIARLASEQEELGLLASPAPGLRSLAAIAGDPPALDAWLAMTASIAEGVDPRTAAAYLISILVWRLGEILAALHMTGAPLPRLDAADLDVSMHVGETSGGMDIQFRFHLGASTPGTPFDRLALQGTIVALHAPLVAALHRRTGLSKSALWRLVSDGISGGFLAHGKRTGHIDAAMVAAHAIIDQTPLLANRQWQFAAIRLPGRPTAWFRLRGGCCRLYRTAGGSLCTTCVLGNRDDQIGRLERFVGGEAG